MPTPIDELTIEIDAKANDANNAIDSLCKKIDTLTTSISKLDVGKLNSLGSGIKRLGDSLQTMKSVDARSISSVVNKINSLSAIDTSKFATVSANLHQMANGIQSLGTVSANAVSVGELANNISKLGNKSVQTAIANIPQLATSLNGLMTTLSHAPRVSQNVIQMTNALANLTAQGSKVGSASNSIVKGLNRTSTAATRSNKSFKGLASTFGKFYANCFLVIRGVKKLWESIESSMDYIETSNYFEVSLSQISKQFERYGYKSAEAYGEALEAGLNNLNSKLTGYTLGASGEALFSGDVGLGMDIESMMNFQAKTLAVTNSVGLLGNASLETTKALSMLVGDLSSLTNLDVESVMNSLSSGLIGQSRALYKFGIDITNNTLQQYALAEGIDKAVSEMTQSEKMQLRLLAILDQSQVAWGDLGNTVNSVANQYRVFEQQIGNLGRTLGNLFLPIVKNVLPYVNGLIIALNNLFTSLGFDLWGDSWLEDLQDGISGSVTDDLEDIEDAADDALESMNELVKGVRGFDVLNVISSGSNGKSGISDELDGTIDLTESIAKAVANYENAWNEAFKTAENKASEFAKTLTEMFKKTNAVENFSKIVESVKKFAEAVRPFTEGFGQGFIDFIRTAAELTLDAFVTSLDSFSGVLNGIKPETLKKIGEAFGVLAGSIATFVTLTAVGKKFTELANGFKLLATTLTAHPILSTFAVSAGILYLIEAFNNSGDIGDVSEKYVGISKELSNILLTIQEVNKETGTFEKKIGEINSGSELGLIYQAWDNLNSKVGELTDEDKGKLKLYGEYIKENFPSLKDLIDENGKAYGRAADEVKRTVENAIKLYKVEAIKELFIEEYKTLAKAEQALKSAQEANASYMKQLKETFSELSDEELKEALDSYQKTGNLWVGTKNAVNLQLERLGYTGSVISALFGGKKLDFDLFLTGGASTRKDVEEVVRLGAETVEILEQAQAAYDEASASVNSLANNYQTLLPEIAGLEEYTGAAKDLSTTVTESGQAQEELTKSTKETGNEFATSTKNLLEYSAALTGLTKLKIPSFGDKISLPKINGIINLPIKGYSVGGFPEDGWFRASKGEYFGKFDDGTSYIANNNQITNGIADGVYKAVVSAMSDIGQRSSDSGDIVINMDGKEVFRIVQNQANQYNRRTGKPAFNI